MKLHIPFGELVGAYEASRNGRRVLLDRRKQELLALEASELPSKMLEAEGQFIPLPACEDDERLVELFVYDRSETIDDEGSERWYEILDAPDTAGHLRRMLEESPRLQEEWLRFRRESHRIKGRVVDGRA